MKNVTFTYEGTEYTVDVKPKGSYSVQSINVNGEEIGIYISTANNRVVVYKILDNPFSDEENLIHEERLYDNKVKASNFLEWHVKEAEDFGLLGYKVYDILRDSGQVSLKVEDLFKESAFIPEKICEERDGKAIGYRPNEVLFIDDITLTDNQKMYYYDRH